MAMTIENLEIMGDVFEDGMTALEEWLDFETDLAEGDPWA